MAKTGFEELSFEEGLGLPICREMTNRQKRRPQSLLRRTKLHHNN